MASTKDILTEYEENSPFNSIFPSLNESVIDSAKDIIEAQLYPMSPPKTPKSLRNYEAKNLNNFNKCKEYGKKIAKACFFRYIGKSYEAFSKANERLKESSNLKSDINLKDIVNLRDTVNLRDIVNLRDSLVRKLRKKALIDIIFKVLLVATLIFTVGSYFLKIPYHIPISLTLSLASLTTLIFKNCFDKKEQIKKEIDTLRSLLDLRPPTLFDEIQNSDFN